MWEGGRSSGRRLVVCVGRSEGAAVTLHYRERGCSVRDSFARLATFHIEEELAIVVEAGDECCFESLAIKGCREVEGQQCEACRSDASHSVVCTSGWVLVRTT